MFLVTGGDDGSMAGITDTTETFDPLVGSWVASGGSQTAPTNAGTESSQH